ncbi:hypothetical protein JCM10212_004802 [Sporobolomyces blumeae]
MATNSEILDQIATATKGFDSLLNNDYKAAESILAADPKSPFSRLGLGTTRFLAAAMSREDDELQKAVETLTEAESLATSELNAKRFSREPSVYPIDLAYKLIAADAVIAQALIAILSESYSGFLSGVWKMNKAYKGFSSVQKAVFPQGYDSSESVDVVLNRLNEHYVARTSEPNPEPTSSGIGSFLPWRRRKDPSLRHASSSPSLASVKSFETAASATAPPSRESSAPGSAGGSVENLATDLDHKATLAPTRVGLLPPPLWKDDPVTTMIIGGATLGAGMFGLILSLLPPKARKLMSWVGFSGTDREGALKLLTISAAAGGQDVHSAFAGLTLLTFYGLILLLSGWQSDEPYLFDQCSTLVERALAQYPEGTLWLLNQAKLARYQRKPDEAIAIIERALSKPSQFREADSLLVFELSWLYLSKANYIKTADSFERMCTMNKWSLATYIAIATGALIEEVNVRGRTPQVEDRLDKLLARLPTLFDQKRLFGEPPVTENFIARRLEAHKVKHARWVEAGRISKDAKLWEVIRITNAMELGLFWSTTGGRSPRDSVQSQIDHLSSMTPAPKYGPSRPSFSGATPVISPSATTNTRSYDPNHDLDSLDEIAIRDLLLGTLYTALGDESSLEVANSFFLEVQSNSGKIVDERWTIAFSLFNRACALLKAGDLKDKASREARTTDEHRTIWKAALRDAESQLDAIATLSEYDFKNRLESRTLMLRNEIAAKKKQLGL